MGDYGSDEEVLAEFSQTVAYEALLRYILKRADAHLAHILAPDVDDAIRRGHVYRLDELQKVVMGLESLDKQRPEHKKLTRLVRVGK